MHITLVAGTRPNFVKISPLIKAIEASNNSDFSIRYRLVHTGQHYDQKMSESFFQELDIPEPDDNLGVGSGSQAEQTGRIMIAFEQVLQEHPTDLVIVVGDVTSTMACSIVAKKLNIHLAHVEGGIRSFDNTMPEEINRKLTDSITDYFFTTSETANENLRKEGIEDNRIFFTGNVMIDTLSQKMSAFRKPELFDEIGLSEKKYLVLTLHRPSNVDQARELMETLEIINANCRNLPVIFPTHPRTKKILDELHFSLDNIHLVSPLSYLEFNYLVKHSMAVITDSGGITEETTVMQIPCMTLRDNTERPETCTIGTNVLVGSDPENLIPHLNTLFGGQWKTGSIPEKWDGNAATRIIQEIRRIFAC